MNKSNKKKHTSDMTHAIAWHTKKVENIAKALHSSLESGLSGGQIAFLQKEFGKNVLEQASAFTWYRGLFKQLKTPLAVILLVSMMVTLFLGEYTDALVIGVSLLIAVLIGVLQEGKAANVFEALASKARTRAVVLRDGKKMSIDSAELVPGDIVFLESGNKVPADIRLISVNNLHINESALTGEWLATEKRAEILKEHDLPPSEIRNMAFMGTVVSEGSGKGIVVETGSNTHFGGLASSTHANINTQTPLSKSILHLAHTIVIIIGIAIAVIFVIGLLRGGAMAEMLLLSVAVAVAAMPEGLPAAVTVTLAVAMEAIMRKGGLVKNLLAAETLGTATVILTDKTGTLTNGVMELSGVHTAEHIDATLPQDTEGDDFDILKMAILASDAFVEGENEDGSAKVHGRPLEKAIVQGALRAGLHQDELFKHGNERIDFVPFSSSRRYAVSLNKKRGKTIMYITGSPEHILSHSRYYYANGEKRKLTDEIRALFAQTQESLSAQGKRFTAVAYKDISENTIPQTVKEPRDDENLGFVFGGLLSFSDTVRYDVPEAIQTAYDAGIRVIMVTGDHAQTAQAIAKDAGLRVEGVVLGKHFDEMSDKAIVLAVKENHIFARMLPNQKLRLAKVLMDYGEVVAMTGDGVNDAPALIAANIGIAQGNGTDVAKEAADMILTTGSFSIIVTAIREGRRALSNLKKIVSYLLSTSASEIVLIGGALFSGLPLPLAPAQILWANIVGEGFMSFPFAFEPEEKGIMKRKPENMLRDGGVFAKDVRAMTLFISFATGFALFVLFIILHTMQVPIDELRTVMFVAISFNIMLLAFSFKNLHAPVWKINIFSNKYLLGGLAISLVILALSLTWSPLMNLLSLVSLNMFDVALLALFGLLNIIIAECAKYIFISRVVSVKTEN